MTTKPMNLDASSSDVPQFLDLENKTLLERLNALNCYKDFLAWKTGDQERTFDKMVELLNEAGDLCRQVDKILEDKDRAEYMAQEQQQENGLKQSIRIML
jgi:hypothetical protein